MHDNTFDGTEPTGDRLGNSNYYRAFRYGTPEFNGQALGDNIWDKNDTEGNGTYVDGHPPHLYASGTVTAVVTGQGNVTITDTSKSWTTNHWVNYSIHNTSINRGSQIISNTNNSITAFYDGAIPGTGLTFSVGDTYKVHKVLQALDQPGTGKGDLLSGEANLTTNLTLGREHWPRNASEPIMVWKNTYTPNGHDLVWTLSTPGQEDLS